MSNNNTVNSPPNSDRIKFNLKGERRFVTVLFCNLISATSLSNQIDPEILQQVLHYFHRYCGIRINRYGGNISQLLGDGVLAYFGYPLTYEDNAQRALRASLDIVNGLHELSTQLRGYTKMEIQVRIGVDTGLVVTSEKQLFISGQAPGVIGKAPNLAAKLQDMATPNSILISTNTQRLVAGMFIVNKLGAKKIKGLSESLDVYQVLEESDSHSRFEAAVCLGLTHFIGRDEEMTHVNKNWHEVKTKGIGRLMMFQGEAGIGKSRLIKNFEDNIAGFPHLTFKCFCSPYFQNSALFPILLTLKQFLYYNENANDEEKLNLIRKILSDLNLPIDDYLGLWAGLFSISSVHFPEVNDSHNEQQRKFIYSIIRWLEYRASDLPIIFIIEDLHWSDPSTLELITQIIERGLIKNTLIIFSSRPEFVASWLDTKPYVQKLDRLNDTDTRSMINSIMNNERISEKALSRLLLYSGGNPLFIEESTKMSMHLNHDNSETIPDTLQDLLLARLDLLGDSKTTAQICAVIGKSFEYDILLAISDRSSEQLRNDIDYLLKAQILIKLHHSIDNYYEFKHALIQEACYQSLLLRSREQCHLSIANLMLSNSDNFSPEIIAYHCSYAKLYLDASKYWVQAGNEATKNSADLEATSFYRKAITVLEPLPNNNQRDSVELDIQVLLGAALVASKGYGASEIGETYQRAKELCLTTQNYLQLYSVLGGLWSNSVARSQLDQCSEYSLELLDLAKQFNDPTANLIANGTAGVTAFVKAQFKNSIEYIDKALIDYDPEKFHDVTRSVGQDPGLVCMGWQMLAYELLSNSDTANQIQRYSMSIVKQLGHAFSESNSLVMSCFLFALQKKFDLLIQYSTELLLLSSKHGFRQILCEAKLFLAYGQGMLGVNPNASTELLNAIMAHSKCHANLNHSFFYGLLTELYMKDQQYDDALVTLNRALDLVLLISDTNYWFKDKLIPLKSKIKSKLLNQQNEESTQSYSKE